MIIWSFILGALNVLILAFALRGHSCVAGCLSIAVQVPWTYYDIVTHQYGFLLISAGSVAVCLTAMKKGHKKHVATMDGF
jgi:hypothetical protein